MRVAIINSYFWDIGYHGIMLRQVKRNLGKKAKVSDFKLDIYQQ